jgi:TPP-dependent pyruvate/acetoin dehydrogenase alpha subunit
MMMPAELIAFEAEVAAAWDAGKIRAPVHLSGGNERQLIDYFDAHFRPGDWICTTWRSHYHALLGGVPSSEVMAAVLRGRSITLTFPAHRVVSSAIVGGIIPIALGIALGIKREVTPLVQASILVEMDLGDLRYDDNGLGRIENAVEHALDNIPRVHCFIGDMTAMTGIFDECLNYAYGHQLPIRFIIEGNGKSVLTDTQEVWGSVLPPANRDRYGDYVYDYEYELPWPHSGAGKRVEF